MSRIVTNSSVSSTPQLKLYNTVIDDVIAGVRDAFLDEGVDEQVLQEMKQVWTAKLMASKAVETAPEPQEQHPPSILANSTKVLRCLLCVTGLTTNMHNSIALILCHTDLT